MSINSFAELVDRVREEFSKADVSSLPPFMAIQIDLTGELGGTFYVEYKDGVLSVEPYEYIDRNIRLEMNYQDFINMSKGTLDPVVAFTIGKLKVEGDVGMALELKKLMQ